MGINTYYSMKGYYKNTPFPFKKFMLLVEVRQLPMLLWYVMPKSFKRIPR